MSVREYFTSFKIISIYQTLRKFLIRIQKQYYHSSFSSVEQIAEEVQQQQEDIADLDEKVDVTIDTAVAIGDKVIEHDKEIGELEEGIEKIEERVDDVKEDMGEAKIKTEEIDNKVK